MSPEDSCPLRGPGPARNPRPERVPKGFPLDKSSRISNPSAYRLKVELNNPVLDKVCQLTNDVGHNTLDSFVRGGSLREGKILLRGIIRDSSKVPDIYRRIVYSYCRYWLRLIAKLNRWTHLAKGLDLDY